MKDFPEGTSPISPTEEGQSPRGGLWGKLAQLWRPEQAPVPESEPLAAEVPPGEQSAQPVAGENATLRAAVDKQAVVDKQKEEPERPSRELEHLRQADAQALEEIRAEVEGERKRGQEVLQAAQQKFSAEIQEALARSNQIHSEAEKLRADLTRTASELQDVGAERQRLQNEYDQLRTESVGLRQAGQEVQHLREQVQRLHKELEQERATTASGPVRGSRKAAELTAELARRDEEVGRLNERVAGLGQELASRSPLVPVSSLHPALQQVLAHMGTAVEAQRIVTELWERLLEQEMRYNAAREDTNRNAVELDELRKEMAELCLGLITPITVLSASADLLAMRQDIPKDALASLEEMRQGTVAVRQVIAKMQKVATPGS